MSTEDSIRAILADWHEWQKAGLAIDAPPIFQKVFDDGVNHDVALISINHRRSEDQQVLKCFAAEHSNAISAQRWANQLGISPKVSYADSDFTYCLMDYIREKPISPDSISSADVSAIAKSLSITHNASIPEFAIPLGMFDLLGFYEKSLLVVDSQAKKLHKKMETPIREFISDTTPMCFCHNDLVAGNCFVIDGQAQFIDWEYSQLNNPWFDLAAIIYYQQLDNKDAAEFLDDYQAGWSVFVGTSIFYTSQLCLLWGDMLWHLAKFGPEFWPRLVVKLNDLERLLKISKSL